MSKSSWRAEFYRRLGKSELNSDPNSRALSAREFPLARAMLASNPGIWFSFSPTEIEPRVPFVSGVRFAFPLVSQTAAGEMEFHLWEGSGDPTWVAHRFGFHEPDPGDANWRHVLNTDRELRGVFVPGLGFDRRLSRLGRGGGFYDRYLQRLADARRNFSSVLTVGIGFSEQLVEELPHENHDVRLDAVVTDRESIWRVA